MRQRILTAAGLALCAAQLGAQQPAAKVPQKKDSTQQLGTVQITASASGQGEARTANALTKRELQERPAGTSALKVLERLPGVNFNSSDPWGQYEWSNRVTMRGFQTQQVGQTFDGLPLGDMSYGNFNGLGIGRAVDAENLAGASVAQGSGALGTSSANNLGGVVQYASDAPNAQRSFLLKQTVGGANTYRTTGRYDTGFWTRGEKGLSGYLSFTRQDNDKWKGAGETASPINKGLLNQNGLFHDGQTWLEQVNGKAVAFLGSTKVTGFYSFSNRNEADYVDLTLARYKQSGRDWDQFSDWNLAKQYANTSGQEDEAYWQSSLGARRDHLAYLLADFTLGASARLTVQPYFHTNKGNGDWHAPTYGPSTWSADPIFFRQTQYDGQRTGANAKLTANLGGNALETGIWYESNTTNIRRMGWGLVNYQTGPAVDFNNNIRLFFDRTGDITTTMLYAQNTNVFAADRLKLTYGAKYVNVNADFNSNGNTANAKTFGDPGRPNLSVSAKGAFLPQVGAVWMLNATEQLFSNYSENINQYPLSPQSGIYNLSAGGFDAFKANTKPERATSVDLGLRTRREKMEGSISAYVIDYRNRLVATANCQLTATCASVISNVGTVSSRGVEGLLNLKLTPALSWANTASYNSSKINDDYKTGTTTVLSGGKSVVDAPQLMANTTIRFAQKGWNGTLGARFVDKRFITIQNDLSVPSYTTMDAGVGYRFERLGVAKNVTVQLNVVNLLDTDYIGSVGTGGFAVKGDIQTLQTGARRLVFLSVGSTF
ncbi:MAG: TonB-dependent receptor [Gemmatimonadaceae bacterium]|nr:TonB-dependent receptor [Gemmatimonadaceae bacterium]